MRVYKVLGGIHKTTGLLWMLIAFAISTYPALAAMPGNHPPTAKNPRLVVPPNQSTLINVADLASDPDVEDQVYVQTSLQPTHGTIGGDGTIYYTPNPDYVGYDSFEYIVSDVIGLTARGTVYLYVGVSNTFPEATALNINVQGGTTQIVRLNSSAALSITVTDEAGDPVPAAVVVWSVTPTCIPTPQPSIAAQVCTDFSEAALQTDSLGIARAKLSIPNASGTYDVTVTVSLPNQLSACAATP